MPDYIMQISALVGIAVMAVIFFLEVRKWSQPGSVVEGKQRSLRIWLFAIIEALLAMWLAGPWVMSSRALVLMLIYWSVCLILCLAAVVLAALDLRVVSIRYSRLARRIATEVDEDERLKK